MPVGRVLWLIGGLALVAAYAMAWFGVSVNGQGIVLSGQFLGRFLASTNDLRQVMPGAAGGPAEVQQLRALVLLFPSAGVLAALLAVVPLWRRAVDVVGAVVGLVPGVALAIGLGQLPPSSRPEIGLWVIGGGAALVVIGAIVDFALGSGQRGAEPVE